MSVAESLAPGAAPDSTHSRGGARVLDHLRARSPSFLPPLPSVGAELQPPRQDKGARASASGEGAGDDASAGIRGRLLVVFAGGPKVGDMRHAASMFGVAAEAVDVLDGGWRHDVLAPEVFRKLLGRVQRRVYDVVWVAPPCSSFSVLHLRTGRERLRTRAEPEGVQRLSGQQREYVRPHNALAGKAAQLARAAFATGATYVVENPVDRGERGSEYFRVRFREHAPICLLPVMRQLGEETGAETVTVAQCAFLGEFQKITTLMAAGPRAHRLRELSWARCTHHRHVRRARGKSAEGGSEAMMAAAYPPVFNAAMVGLLFADAVVGGETLRAACGSAYARALHERVMLARGRNREAARAFCDGAASGEQVTAQNEERQRGVRQECVPTWLADPKAMPSAWPESSEWHGPAAEAAAAAELRYVSRRRADAEPCERLVAEALPQPTAPPSTRAQPTCVDSSWPEGAPEPPVAIEQLFLPGRGVCRASASCG